MPELRWILLAAGLVLLVGIYIYGRVSARKSAPPQHARVEPNLAPGPVAPPGATESPSRMEREAAPTATPPTYEQSDLPLKNDSDVGGAEDRARAANEKIIAIHIAAKSGRRFRGADLVHTFATENLEFGEFDIYHRHTGNRPIFSVSSMVEPGTFDPQAMEDFSTPGLSMFMVIPGPESPVGVFTEMLSTARRIATALDGEVLDESGSTLSRQAASHLREQIIEFAHRVR